MESYSSTSLTKTITPGSSPSQPEIDLLPFIKKVRVAKEGMFLFRRRRHNDWTDNYTLYRDKVQMNRLTQRQSVNIPLIKSAIKTLLKDVDEPPILYFTNIDNDDQAELYLNEYWKDSAVRNKLVIKDIVDKRQMMLFGRSFKNLNIVNGEFYWDVGDPQDYLVDRYVDPADIDSARQIVQQHIYYPLSSITSNPQLDTAEVHKLQKFMATKTGLIRAEENQLDFVERQKRLASMGVIDIMSPILGEAYVELNKVFIKEFNPRTKKDEITYALTAEDMSLLYKVPLEECIGVTPDHFWTDHYPINTWADENDRTDFWSDGVADSLRTLNKVLNSWFSQMVENRTLRNFGMTFFNSSLTEEGFTPQTFEPVPFGFYPIPAGDKALGDQLLRVEIPDLKDSLDEMQFIMTVAQQASAATTFQQGTEGERKVTLGEVQLLLSQAKERVKSMSVYYTDAWYDFGLKFSKMIEASPDKLNPVTLNKKGRLTKKIYSKTISPKDFLTKSGYQVEVKMKADVAEETTQSLQKLQYAKVLMPANQALDTIIKKKSLDFADLAASEISQVMQEDEQMKKQMMANPMMGAGQPMPGQPGQPMGGQPAGPGPMALPAQAGQPAMPQPMSA